MTNKKYRNNYETLIQIEDVTNETEFEGQEIPYRLSEFKKNLSGIPTDNLYWTPYDDGHYMVDNGNGMMFYLDADSVCYPSNPLLATEIYYCHLIIGKTKHMTCCSRMCQKISVLAGSRLL